MLHSLCKEPKSALLMACMPPCTPTGNSDALLHCYNLMLKNEITPCWELEGCKYPIKFNTHEEHLKIKIKVTGKLKAFYELRKDLSKELTDEDHSESIKIWK